MHRHLAEQRLQQQAEPAESAEGAAEPSPRRIKPVANHLDSSNVGQLAEKYSREVEVLRDMLAEEGIKLDETRHSAELLRFAAAHGLLTVCNAIALEAQTC